MHHPFSMRMVVITTASVAVLLSACDRSESTGSASSQVVAKVNGQDVSVHQLNLSLGRLGKIDPDRVPQIRRQALDQLVDQELLLQAALDKKFDRDPQVIQMVEQTRREVIARAYVERSMATASKPSAEEVAGFFSQHPELFAQRKVYSFQELAIAAPQDSLKPLPVMAEGARSLADVASWLKERKLNFTATSAIRPAEQIPWELVPKFAALRDGQVTAFPTGAGATVVQLTSSQHAPINLQTATPFIEQYLANQKRTELAEGMLKDLKTRAKIEFRGEFAGGAPVPAPAGTATPAQTKSGTEHMDRGVAGLR